MRANNNDLEGYVYKLRGFSSLNLFRNGLTLPLTIATIKDTANLERIEVLKGPASILYGRVDPGTDVPPGFE
ncbi:MAG TPA: TonB-dependent receptor plug domain-containing protein [Candidatus Acidoferrales bacterium]|nr:TonB-dependent receptor plug domain-containing protein [Candidatus Acidoferrales bacterium]